MANEERLQILDMIASGKISAQEGIELLNALGDEENPAGELAAGEVQSPVQPELPVETDVAIPAPPELPVEAAMAIPTQPELPMDATPAIPAQPIPEPVANYSSPEGAAAVPQSPHPGTQTAAEGFESLPETPSFDPRAKKWQGWWRIPLWIGVIATILTGLLMYSLYRANGFGFWFACSWFPFLLSVAIVALAWASRSAHWIHIRVHQPPGERPQNIVISFPIPLTLMAWFLRTFRNKIPGIQGANADEMILALHHVTPDKPLYVEVNEEDGQHVEVYIG